MRYSSRFRVFFPKKYSRVYWGDREVRKDEKLILQINPPIISRIFYKSKKDVVIITKVEKGEEDYYHGSIISSIAYLLNIGYKQVILPTYYSEYLNYSLNNITHFITPDCKYAVFYNCSTEFIYNAF